MNIADIKNYVAAIEQGRSAVDEIVQLSAEDIACETAVLNLRCRCGINFEQYKKHTGFDAAILFSRAIKHQCELGLLEVDEHGVRLTAGALPIADTVLAEFATME